MKKNRFFIAGIILLVLFTLGTTTASDTPDNITLVDSSQDTISESDEMALPANEEADNESAAIELIEDEDYNVKIPKYVYSDDLSSIISVENMPLDAKGNISIFLNDTEIYNEKVSVGCNGIYLGDLSEGKYNVKINYTGDEKYAGFAKTGVVESTFLHLTMIQTRLSHGEGYVFCEVTLDEGVSGYIKISVDGRVIFNEKYRKNQAYRYYDGVYEKYEVKYYNGNHKDVTIKGESTKAESEESEPLYIPSNLIANQSTYLEFNSVDDSEGYLILSGMINRTINVSEGTNYIPISSETVGTHCLNIAYKNYTWTKNIKVKAKADVNINYPKSMNYGQNKQITLDDYHNATLVLYMGAIDVSKGCRLQVAQFDLNQIKEISLDKTFLENVFNNSLAEAIVKSNYEEDESNHIELKPVIYSDYETFDDFDPIYVHFDAKFTGFQNVALNYLESKTIKFTVYDMFKNPAGKDKTVKLTIGSKTYSAKTDKNSVVKFKIPNTLTPGKYTLKVTYKLTAVKKLTVKHILTLNTAKVKKSAKKLYLTAKLNKKLKGKSVTFKFNGKTYKTKTNSKGIAKVTIKSSVLKKLKVGKKVTYQATYIKDTVKKSVKVKR